MATDIIVHGCEIRVISASIPSEKKRRLHRVELLFFYIRKEILQKTVLIGI